MEAGRNNTDRQEDDTDGLEIEFTTVSVARLKMFSDAVWSIIATIMVNILVMCYVNIPKLS